MTGAILGFILRMMSIIDRYFSRQLIAIFVMLLLILTGLAWMVQIMAMMKFLMNYGVELTNFLGLTLMMVPFIISIIIPFVTFIAVLFVYNKMISDTEIIVLAASGWSPIRIAKPALWLAGILTVAHLVLNIFIVPATQAQFYDTQWNLRYGLAHMKLQEGAFTEISHGRVVYVDKVSGHDLNQVMLSDIKDDKSKMIVFARQGKLVSTMRGLSIVMSDGSLQMSGTSNVVGTFDNFDMDLSITEKSNNSSFRVRRLSTGNLIKSLTSKLTDKQYKTVISELCTRFLSPFMNFILAAIALAILLRSSLLRRRTSFAPAFAVLTMSVIMATFMSVSGTLETINQLIALGGVQVALMGIIIFALARK